ncbi:THUMP domain-containing protein 1 [Palaemon carinicauda]|uniref:THUMP domain-containing protein 1 n=1 Tax=Palaemon carinicauda TaxID=392227 RepID=UPI0035B65D8B
MGKNKRSRSYYIRCAKRQRKGSVLGTDMVGFLCTCNNSERDCVREAYNILNEFADKLYGKESQENIAELQSENAEMACKEGEGSEEIDSKLEKDKSPSCSDDEEPLDIEAAIKAEVSELKNNQNKTQPRRFQQVLCGAKNCVFIQTTLKDPLPLSLAIMDELLISQKQRTQKLLRMVPVQTTCKAYPEDIKKAVQELASLYFKEKGQTFCVIFKVRNNTKIKKENMAYDLATILQTVNSENKPNLNCPEVVLSVDIIRNICLLGFMPHYFTKYSKYNLVLLANKDKALVNTSSGDSDKLTEENDCSKDVDAAVAENDKAILDDNYCKEEVIPEKKDDEAETTVVSPCGDGAEILDKDKLCPQTTTEKDVVT